MPTKRSRPPTEEEKLEAFVAKLGPKRPGKPRKRPGMKGAPGVERGSPAAAERYWAEVAQVMEAKGKRLPDPKPFGFVKWPSPPTAGAHKVFTAWQAYDRENDRQTFSILSLDKREALYWHAVDHAEMFAGPMPDAYVFGFDELPVRGTAYPEPPYAAEIREARAGAEAWFGMPRTSSPAEAALAKLGLRPGATKAEITNAFRKAALETHPDRGGTAAAVQAIVAAKNTALAALEKSR